MSMVQYVPEIVSFIEKLIARGVAYEANGSVYFDTKQFTGTCATNGTQSPCSPAVMTASMQPIITTYTANSFQKTLGMRKP
jgi:cysteinyl-tRNA synthetase